MMVFLSFYIYTKLLRLSGYTVAGLSGSEPAIFARISYVISPDYQIVLVPFRQLFPFGIPEITMYNHTDYVVNIAGSILHIFTVY